MASLIVALHGETPDAGFLPEPPAAPFAAGSPGPARSVAALSAVNRPPPAPSALTAAPASCDRVVPFGWAFGAL